MPNVLPIDDALPGLIAALRRAGQAVLQAPPGAGKTTRVPLALLQAGICEGRIVMLFPEGTRVLPGQRKPFKIGGAILAAKTGYPIVPIAHNAGEFWPRHSWIKWPGTIRVVIGPLIEPADKKPDQIIQEVERWITQTGDRISDSAQLERLDLPG